MKLSDKENIQARGSLITYKYYRKVRYVQLVLVGES